MTETTQNTLAQRWTYLDGKKSNVLSRCEEYAQWTLPWLFPQGTQTENVENQLSSDSIGARAVNHLSNKVVTTLFSPQRPFFRLRLSRKDRRKIKAIADGQRDQAKAAEFIAKIDTVLNDTEQEAIEYLDMVAYRPQATYASQLLVTTGNALMYHPEGEPVQVFNLRDYCVVRDLSGTVIEIITRECKAFETFHPDVQVQIRSHSSGTKEYEDKDDITVYTQIKLHDDGKFYAKQEAANVELLHQNEVSWPRKKLPWIALTWNLVRGEDYGRGLVEDYSGAFHALSVLSNAIVNLGAIMGDLKFLVNPNSNVDVQALNNSKAGSYHSGKDGDVSAIETKKQHDAQFIISMIEKYERQISQAFLLNSGVTRSAERVTAEEIRMQANELETSNGGIYSRLALQWQLPTANIVLDHIHFQGGTFDIEPQIVTGMDSLSRVGELDNLRMFMADLQMLNEVPEGLQAAINPLKFIALIGTNRQVDYNAFLYTQDEMDANAARQQQMMQQQEQAKAGGVVAAEAGKAAVKEAQTG